MILIHQNNNFNKSKLKEKNDNKGVTSKLFNLKQLNILRSINYDINIVYKTHNESNSTSVHNSIKRK